MINYLILVNKKNKYFSQNIKLVESKSLYANRLVEEKTLDTFNKLKEHLKNKGILIEIQSAYRDIDYQKRIWVNCVDKKGLEYTKKYVAKPGYSEHHTGLAIDFCLNENNKFIIEHDLDNNESLKIIHDNLYKFGFILRYPKNKENITGYNYEPWHIRFIDDKNIAKYIYENNMCLEDYLNDK